jgi:cation diffusion facilitator CzcD-associated flavoprotein CzcO
MLDATQTVPSGSGPVCILGAGLSGLVTAKVFLQMGRDVVVVDKAAEIGGVWAPSRSYPGVQTQTPRDLYCFSDFPMPSDYPEWPTGPQVYDYLCRYATRFGVLQHVRLNTEIIAATPTPAGWQVSLRDASGERTEPFAQLVICSGQFSQPRTLDLPGVENFCARGGVVTHSSGFADDKAASGRDVVVLGYSKSATDVAMQALAANARSVTMVYREPTWKIPYFFGNLVNFKNILYCRASELMFMPWAPSRVGRIGRAIAAPAIWANWRALESLLQMQFGLKRNGLRPAGRIEDSIHCTTSIETPGFYKAVNQGRIRMVRGTLASAGAGAVVTDSGETLKADLVVLAIGFTQGLHFLDAATQAALVTAEGQYQLYRMLVHPDVPNLGFVGFNSSFITTLSAELGAHWLARWFAGAISPRPTASEMHAEIADVLAWRKRRPVAAAVGGLCVAPYHFFHFDQLLRDMGARTRPANPIVANLLPINPKHYAALLASAPAPAANKTESVS